MPADAVGAVRTEATFESAQFEEGTKRARAALGKFDSATKQTQTSLAGLQANVQNAARLIAVAFAAVAGSALTRFIVSAVETTAELGRMAAQAGLTSTQFQQLSFAFREAANVTQEQLATGLAQLQRNLADLNRDTGPFLDFLRQAYPALVDQFRGITDVNTAMDTLIDAASRILDPMDRMRFLTQAGGEAFGRLANSLPAVRRTLDQVRTDFRGVGEDAVNEALRIEREWNRVWESIQTNLRRLGLVVASAFASVADPMTNYVANVARINEITGQLERRVFMTIGREQEMRGELNRLIEAQVRMLGEAYAATDRLSRVPPSPAVAPRSQAELDLLRFQADLFLQLANGSRILEQSLLPLGQAYSMFSSQLAPGMLGSLADLNLGMMTHADIVEEAQRRIQAAYTNTAEAQRVLTTVTQQMNLRYQQQQQQTAQAVGKALVDVFPKSKAAAAAQALINTAVGVTQALTLPFPLNWIQAAAVLASGIAQVNAIKSTSLGGGGSLPSPGGGAGAGGGGGVDAGRRPTEIVVTGINPGDLFSGEQVLGLIGAINTAVENGHVLIASKAMNRS